MGNHLSGTTITLTMPLKEVKVFLLPASVVRNLLSILGHYLRTQGNRTTTHFMSWVGGNNAEGHDSTPSTTSIQLLVIPTKFSEIVITRGYQHGISLTGTVDCDY